MNVWWGIEKNENNFEGTGCVDWELSVFLEGLCKFTKPCDMTLWPVRWFKFEPRTSKI